MDIFCKSRPGDKKEEVGAQEDLPAKTSQGGQYPLQMRIHGRRVLTGTLVSVAVLAMVTVIFLNGVEITTLDATQLSDDDRRALVDKYNSYSGSIASVVSIPFQQLPSLLMPVFFLCFTAHAVLADNKSFLMEWGPVISLGVVSYMIGLGLNSLNVQFDTTKLQYIILNTDLTSYQVDTSDFTKINNVTNSTHITSVSSTDTILRAAIVPTIETSDIICTNTELDYAQKPEASIEFGFPVNSWLGSLLPKSVASSKSFTFSMQDDFTNQHIDAVQLPSGNLRKTAVLLTSAVCAMFEQFIIESRYISNYADNLTSILEEDVNSSDASSLLTNIQSTISTIPVILDAVDAEMGWDTHKNFWQSIATSEIFIELSSFQLSPQISFEAVTFDMPVNSSTLDDWFAADDWRKNGSSQTNIFAGCSDLGCIVETPNDAGTKQDQVRLIPLCAGENEWGVDMLFAHVTCKTISKSSVLVFSLARHMSVDEFVVDLDKSFTMINPRLTYQATVGRLSWNTEDLAIIYDANCAEGANCHGLFYPLSDGKNHLVVGEEFIPVPQNTSFSDPTQWQMLVMANTQLDGTKRGDIVPYQLTPQAAETYNGSRISSEYCLFQAAEYVTDIIERHIYSKDSVQPAYTAAIFWLFHHAAVKEIETGPSSNTTGVRLLFNGNRSWVSVHAAIPFASACVTLVGCGLALILGVSVAWRSQDQQRQASLASHIAAHNVSALLADGNQFPPLLVSVGVPREELSIKIRTTDPIGRFKIVRNTITLRDELDMSERTIVIESHNHTRPSTVGHDPATITIETPQ